MASTAHFLAEPEVTPAAQAMFDDDLDDPGFVMNVSRLWAHDPAVNTAFFDLLAATVAAGELTFRQRGILVTACASTIGDSYCSLAWGAKLAKVSDPDTAAGVLAGDDSHLTGPEQAMARWARKVAGDPNGTTETDLQELREAGYSDSQIFAITVFSALRLAFSTVNDALGAAPDGAFRSTIPAPVRQAVTFGRPIADPLDS